MPSRRPISSLSATRRRLALGWLFVYLLSTIGLPMPAPLQAAASETLANPAEPRQALAPCGCPAEAEKLGTCCCRKGAATAGRGCCAAKRLAPASNADATTAQAKTAQPRPSRDTVAMAIAARHCQGLADTWISVDIAIPLPSVTESIPATLIEHPRLLVAACPVIFADPPVPPPRLLALFSAA